MVATIGDKVVEIVGTVGTNVTSIVTAFSGLVTKLAPVINAVGNVIAKIGKAVKDVVDSVGTSTANIVKAFADLNKSLAEPIKAIGEAISGVITSISDGVVEINKSVAGILEKLAGVFDSIGTAAEKAGSGFKTVADAAIALANETSVVDLAASLGAVAKGIKDINKEAKWAHDQKIGDAVAEVGTGLASMISSAEGLDTVVTSMDSFADAVKKINNECKTTTSLDTYSQKINSVATNAGVDLGNLGTFATDALGKMKTMCTDGKTALSGLSTDGLSSIKSLADGIKSPMDTIKTSITTKLQSAVNSARNAFASLNSAASNSMQALVARVERSLTQISSKFAAVRLNMTKHIAIPHFSMSGSFNAETGAVPSVRVSWYDKGGIFTQPSIIGIAEKRPEFVGALDDLREIVREEAGIGSVTINVYGSEGQNVRELADIVMDEIQMQIAKKGAAFA